MQGECCSTNILFPIVVIILALHRGSHALQATLKTGCTLCCQQKLLCLSNNGSLYSSNNPHRKMTSNDDDNRSRNALSTISFALSAFRAQVIMTARQADRIRSLHMQGSGGVRLNEYR